MAWRVRSSTAGTAWCASGSSRSTSSTSTAWATRRFASTAARRVELVDRFPQACPQIADRPTLNGAPPLKHRFVVLVVLTALVSGCTAGRAYRQGQESARAGDWDAAVTYFTRAVQDNPDN